MNQTTPHYVIIGGVAGGMSAATRLRRLNESATITILERSGYVSFANCGLPYYIGGIIEDRQSLLLNTPESLAARFRLNVLTHTEATHIDPTTRTVHATNHTTHEPLTLHYDALILSPGATPITPPIPGIDRALTLRTIEDTDRIHAAAHATPTPRTAAIIGGGFIGLEVAENLNHLGLDVHLIEAAPHILAPLDTEMAALVHHQLRSSGIHLHLNQTATTINDTHVTTSTGEHIPADLVIAAIGVKPDTRLAETAGLTLGPRGGIQVDHHMRTSDPHIYAIGDAVEKVDELSKDTTLVPLANTANRQGRIVADIISGRPGADRAVLGTAILSVCGLTVATSGWNERRLRAAKRPYRAIHTHPASHATYYPGAAGMSLKLLVDPHTDSILGVQGVGTDGVDKRIDVIATAMAAGMKASDLADLELAYAPPFGSAKDPVNMLGYINQNTAQGLTDTIQWHELDEAMAAGATLVDVRTPGEVANGSIPGAVNIPLDELRDRLAEIGDGPVIVTCQVGLRGHLATQILRQHGYAVRNLDGGYRTWSTAMNL